MKSTKNEQKNATLELRLVSDSGYLSHETDIRISARQWGDIQKIIHQPDTEISDTDRLNWLFSNGISKFSKEILFGTIVNESNFRDEIDKIMKKGSI